MPPSRTVSQAVAEQAGPPRPVPHAPIGQSKRAAISTTRLCALHTRPQSASALVVTIILLLCDRSLFLRLAMMYSQRPDRSRDQK
jgi:hypothetical protein